jgi:transposase
MRYTYQEFLEQFPDDKSCLSHLFKTAYRGKKCPECGRKKFYPITGRRSYACLCGHHVYPTHGTIFHKSKTPLRSWFYAIYLMSQSRNGVSARELQRQLGVTYKCAWRMSNRIRKLMEQDKTPLEGVVEADETYIGGRHKGPTGRGALGKTAVFGIVQRQGNVRAIVVDNVKTYTLLNAIKESVRKGSVMNTDEMLSYQLVVTLGIEHQTVKHSAGEYVRGDVHTNSIEGFWGQLKRSLSGTYCSVSRKHLQSYLDEFVFRYDHRHDEEPLPLTLLSMVGKQVSKGA